MGDMPHWSRLLPLFRRLPYGAFTCLMDYFRRTHVLETVDKVCADRLLEELREKQTQVTNTPFTRFCPIEGDLNMCRRVFTHSCGCQTTQTGILVQSDSELGWITFMHTPRFEPELMPKWATVHPISMKFGCYKTMNYLKGTFTKLCTGCDESVYVWHMRHLSHIWMSTAFDVYLWVNRIEHLSLRQEKNINYYIHK